MLKSEGLHSKISVDDLVTQWRLSTEQAKLKCWKIMSLDVMNKIYKRKKISGELHQTVIEVINKCPTMEHLTAIMDSFGYRRTTTTIYSESSESWTNE